MEREILMGGIGGQGIQITTMALAQAAILEGKHALHFGMFMGSIRGGDSQCIVILGTKEIETPPIVPDCWAAIAMHPSNFSALTAKVRSGGFILVNTSLISGQPYRKDVATVEVPASGLASEKAGHIMGACMVALGAFAQATQVVKLDSIIQALTSLLPPHRQQMTDIDKKCLHLGAEYIHSHAYSFSPVLAWARA
jgi:Pyruvate/2-oxoacid:ferredoxin oxidoreductase gamma subunit